jgi:phage gp29-like protein
MAKRFDIPPIPKGEVAQYSANPYNRETVYGYYPGIMHTGTGDVIVRPNDELLLQKGGISALIIYQRLLFDANVQAAWEKVTQEITARDLIVEAASDSPGDQAVKEFVENQIYDLPMDEIFKAMLEAYVVGFSVGEIMWRRTKAGVKAYDVRPRDVRRFLFQESEDADMGFTMKLVTRANTFEGEELPARKFVTFRYWAQANGDPYGCGLGRILYPIVKFKRRALESQLLYSDRFANPTAVATAPLSATTSEIDTLYNHLTNLSQETALILPEGYNLEFINPQGSPETFSQLRDSLIKEINMLIAGEDEAGSADSGSRASSEVAQTVREVRAQELSELLCATLNETLVRWIVDLNFGTNVIAPKIRRNFITDDLSSLTMNDVATMISQVGYRPTKEWIENTFKVELEEEEDNVAEPPVEEQAPEEAQSDEKIVAEVTGEGSEEPAKTDSESAPATEVETTTEESDDEPMDELLSSLEEPPTMEAEGTKTGEEDEDEELNKLIDELLG